jgi:putative transposase
MKYQFIEQHKQEFPIVVMCHVLEVSESGLYAWRKRPVCQRKREDAQLSSHIRQIFVSHRKVYGSPRIHAQLADQGYRCSRKRIARLMRENGITASRKRRRVVTTNSRHENPVAPNLLQRDFTAQAPNRKWATDITYIPTAQGWLYVAVVLDLYSRLVVGWSMAAHCDEELVENALCMALARRRPSPGLLHHSDRGSQYCSRAYQHLLEQSGMIVSMSRKGNCWDNAAMESFFGSLKEECVGNTLYRSHEEARLALFTYLEIFYNRLRRHSTLGNVSPLIYEQRRGQDVEANV